MPPDVLINYWFTRYLWGRQNGVENLPKSWVVREANACPPRESAYSGEHVNTATLAVADASPFRIGFTLTIPQTNANVGSSAVPLNLLSYPGPISNDAVSLGFKQSIGSSDALRTGTYSKTLTFTLSTTQP